MKPLRRHTGDTARHRARADRDKRAGTLPPPFDATTTLLGRHRPLYDDNVHIAFWFGSTRGQLPVAKVDLTKHIEQMSLIVGDLQLAAEAACQADDNYASRRVFMKL